MEKRERLGALNPDLRGVLDDMPRLPPDAVSMLNAYLSLNRTRTAGFGPCAITFQEMNAYLDAHGFESHEYREDFIQVISEIDAVMLQKAHDAQKTEKKKNERNRRGM